MLHDINERLKFRNIDGVTRVCRYLEVGLLINGGVATAGSIKCQAAHNRVECMDKTEMRLRRLLYEVITFLLSHNKLLDHVMEMGAHLCRPCSSTDIAIHAGEHTGLGQTWVELQHFFQQNTSTDPFIYCEEEEELRGEESNEHPRYLKEKATGSGVTFTGYVEVQSAPYAYDQGTEAKRDDPKSAPLV